MPEDPAALAALHDQLTTLHLMPVSAQATSAGAAQVSGRRYTLAENATGFTTVQFDFDLDNDEIVLGTAAGEQRFSVGHGFWTPATVGLAPQSIPLIASPNQVSHAVSASGGWQDDSTYTFKVWWVHTPFARTFTFRFAANRLAGSQIANANMGPLDGPPLRGWA